MTSFSCSWRVEANYYSGDIIQGTCPPPPLQEALHWKEAADASFGVDRCKRDDESGSLEGCCVRKLEFLCDCKMCAYDRFDIEVAHKLWHFLRKHHDVLQTHVFHWFIIEFVVVVVVLVCLWNRVWRSWWLRFDLGGLGLGRLRAARIAPHLVAAGLKGSTNARISEESVRRG